MPGLYCNFTHTHSYTHTHSLTSQIRPQVVLLELCPDRQGILGLSEDQIRTQSKNMNWDTIKQYMRRDGTVAGLTQALFIKMSANIMEKLGVVPGGEFRAGYNEGKRMRSAIVLGDRRINLTFKRALRSLPLWQQLVFIKLMTVSLIFEPDITLEDVEKMKGLDMVQMLTGKIS